METEAQTCSRLVTALEDLADQEAASMRSRDFAAVVEIQKRAGPLVRHLAEHGPRVADAAFRRRVSAVIQRREMNEAWLSAEIEKTREQLHVLDAGRRRAAQVAPVYGHVGFRRNRLRAVG